MLEKIFQENFSSHLDAIEKSQQILESSVIRIGKLLAKSLANGNTVFWSGNGGSAADSQHLAAELVGRFRRDRKALRSVALTTDSSVLTCISNDYSYDDIFARQVEALGREGDVLVVISTSGKSKNILNALHAAKNTRMATVALLGKEGGPAKDLADLSVIVPSDSTARIQEVHILVGHILCEMMEQELGIG